MALDATKLCNMAMSLFGNDRINDIDEDTATANLCKLWYEQIRDEVLTEAGVRWRCASTRKKLSQLSTAPDFGWSYQYQLPADPKLLRLDYFVNEKGDYKRIPWLREGDAILTNETECRILYIFQLTDPAKFSPLLAEAIYTKLGSVLAGKIAQHPKKAEQLMMFYRQDVLLRAKAANGQETYIEDETGVDEWGSVGRRRLQRW